MTYRGKTIQKHTRGNWFARVRYNGKVISIYGRTQLEAYEKLKAFVDAIEVATFNKKFQERLDGLTIATQSLTHLQQPTASIKIYTLKEWFNEWLNSYKVGSVRIGTIKEFKQRFKHFVSLENAELGSITNLMLSKAINSVKSARVKDGVHNLAKQMFSTAFNNRIIESNPTLNLPRPKQVTVYEKQAFTAEQEKIFIEFCLKDLDEYEPFLICILQGLRKGEMLALRPNDLDFVNNTLRVDESYDEQNPQDLQIKNQDSNRTMPMFNLTKQILLKYANSTKPNERIYSNFTTVMLGNNIKEVCKQAKLPKLTTHELRHTFISRCHEKGIDEIIVQKWVGHAKGSRMTKAVYTHIGNEAEQGYIARLNEKAINVATAIN